MSKDQRRQAQELVSQMSLDEKVWQITMDAPAIPRLNITAHKYWNECIHGVTAITADHEIGVTTCFPMTLGMSASWNTDLLEAVGDAMGDEARAKYFAGLLGLTYYCPNINILRDPRWGRALETYGEDPFLTSRMAVSIIDGLQGNHDDVPFLKVAACAKHFAVHSGPDFNSYRLRFNSDANKRDLYETYLPAFEASVKEAKVEQIMMAYNRFKGVACTANEYFIKNIIRDDWGYDGLIVSDAGAMEFMHSYHEVSPSYKAAGVDSIKAGCDMEVGRPYCFKHLAEAVNEGLVEEKLVGKATTQTMITRIRLGQFEDPATLAYAKIDPNIAESKAHKDLAYKVAQQSMVLLKNEDQALPLNKAEVKKIAVLGPNADDMVALRGNYFWSDITNPITPLKGLQDFCQDNIDVNYEFGVPRDRLELSQHLNDCPFVEIVDGISLDYFNSPDCSGTPCHSEQVETMEIMHAEENPGHGIDIENWSTKWSCKLKITDPRKFKFITYNNGSTRLKVNGEEIFFHEQHHDDWNKRISFPFLTDQTDFEVGEIIDFEAEFYRVGISANAKIGTMPLDNACFAPAIEAAKNADVAIVCLGLCSELTGDPLTGLPGYENGTQFLKAISDEAENNDRKDIALSKIQEDFLKEIHATGTKTILVMLNGGPLTCEWAHENVPAIIEAWYPGQAGGTAIADVLFGEYNPAGRLTATVYRNMQQLPDFLDYNMQDRTYKYFNGDPLYPFGYGLSYTSFDYSDLAIGDSNNIAGNGLKGKFTIKNTGGKDGDEVYQVYLKSLAAQVDMPNLTLAAFGRINLKAGESKTLEFNIKPRQFSFYDETKSDWTLATGKFELFCGGQQPGFEKREDLVATKIISCNFDVTK